MTLENVADSLDPDELAIEPRSLALIAYYDGWGQAVGMRAMTYPRRLTKAEAEHWQEGWNEGRADARRWESAAATVALTAPGKPDPGPPPDGFVDATSNQGRYIRWACSMCGASGMAGGRWMETHRRTHHRCPDCGRWLTAKLDGTPRVHTRCPRKGPTWSTSPRPT